MWRESLRTSGFHSRSDQVIKVGQPASAGLSGKVIPDQDIKIVSKVAGKVASVNVQEGSKVKQGDVLVQLETSDLTQQMKQAESALVAAQAKLVDTKAGARSQEIQGLQSAVSAAQGAYQQATAAMEQAKAGLDLATSTYNRLRNSYDSNSGVTQEDLDKGTLDFEKAKAGSEQAQGAQKRLKHSSKEQKLSCNWPKSDQQITQFQRFRRMLTV